MRRTIPSAGKLAQAYALDGDRLTFTAFTVGELDSEDQAALHSAVGETAGDFPEVMQADLVVRQVDGYALEAAGEWVILRSGYRVVG